MRIYKVFTLLGLFISIFYNCSLPADDEEDSEGEDTLLPNFLGKEKQINSLSILKKESI